MRVPCLLAWNNMMLHLPRINILATDGTRAMRMGVNTDAAKIARVTGGKVLSHAWSSSRTPRCGGAGGGGVSLEAEIDGIKCLILPKKKNHSLRHWANILVFFIDILVVLGKILVAVYRSWCRSTWWKRYHHSSHAETWTVDHGRQSWENQRWTQRSYIEFHPVALIHANHLVIDLQHSHRETCRAGSEIMSTVHCHHKHPSQSLYLFSLPLHFLYLYSKILLDMLHHFR